MSRREICSPVAYTVAASNRYTVTAADGIELGLTIAKPTASGRFPALLWCDPYRQATDGQASARASYFASRGYAYVNLHVRGTGNSEGASVDEYTAEETRDACTTIAWLAAQPWCSGRVGMLGTSYSGFTAIQAAAEAPPALAAIAPGYFTDRRYTDDCHYKGGCLRGYYDMLTYGMSMVPRNVMPPDPIAAGARWSKMWQQRLDDSEPYLLKWLSQPLENEYWACGSVLDRVQRITAASLLIGGWHDGYVNPPLRVFPQLRAPKRLLMGPWAHNYGNVSRCGPRIDIYYELLRWFDRWLKDLDNGIDDEPAVQIYVREHEEPRTDRIHLAGGWYGAAALPVAPTVTFHAAAGLLVGAGAETAAAATVAYRPAASLNGGLWDAGVPFQLPGPQNTDEVWAINFTSAPLREDLRICGQPQLRVFISADVPVIPVAARLCAVDECGLSVLVTRGILNATRRHGMDRAEPLVPGEVTELALALEATAWHFRAGQRLRLSINGSDFPNVWPTPYPGQLTVHWGPAQPTALTLPVWEGATPLEFAFLPSPDAPAAIPPAPCWQIIQDVVEDRTRLRLSEDQEMCVSNRDPATAWARRRVVTCERWPGAEVRAEAAGALRSTQEAFSIDIAVDVYLNDQLYFQKSWSLTTPRLLL